MNVDQLAANVAADPRLDLAVASEVAFYAEQSASHAALINTFAYLIAGIMAVGAVVASLNTMYTAVSQRTVEIGTLRALGFKSASVAASVVIESMLLGLVGCVLAAGLVWLAFDGYIATTQNSASGNQIAFAFRVTPALVGLGTTAGLLLGLFGGVLPALRAARLPITRALRGG